MPIAVDGGQRAEASHQRQVGPQEVSGRDIWREQRDVREVQPTGAQELGACGQQLRQRGAEHTRPHGVCEHMDHPDAVGAQRREQREQVGTHPLLGSGTVCGWVGERAAAGPREDEGLDARGQPREGQELAHPFESVGQWRVVPWSKSARRQKSNLAEIRSNP